MFWIMALYQMCLLPVFSPRLWLFFPFSLTLSFTQQKIFILVKSRISIISFMNCAFGIVSKKSLSCLRSSRFSPVLSPRSFIPLCFKSVIDFELIFMKSVLIFVKKIFLHVFLSLALLWVIWNLSYLTRDWTWTPCIWNTVLTTGPPGKSP